jgi:hypothetical protein
MRALRGALYIENWNNPLLDLKELNKQLSEIDLISILSKCQIDPGIKYFLSELVNYHNYLDLLNDSNKLANDISDNKQKTEKGGASLNSDIPSLEQKIFRCFNLSNVNYIINTNTSYTNVTFINGITGLLLGHSIPERKFKLGGLSNSRLNFITKNHLVLMIYMIPHKEFAQIFKRYPIDSIKLDTEAVETLDLMIKNINEQSELILSLMNDKDLFINRFQNILFVSIKAKGQLQNKKLLYDIFLKYFYIDRFYNQIENLLIDLIEYTPCSIEQSIQIFKQLLSIKDYSSIPITLLRSLSEHMHKENIVLTDITSVNQLNIPLNIPNVDVDYIAPCYHLVDKKVQSEILNYFRTRNLKCDSIALLVLLYNIPVFDSELLIKYIRELKENVMIKSYEQCVCAIFEIFETTSDSELKRIIQEYSDENEFLKFLMAPNCYPIDMIKKEWFYYCKDIDLQAFMNNEVCRKNMKEYADGDNDFSKEFKRKIWELL